MPGSSCWHIVRYLHCNHYRIVGILWRICTAITREFEHVTLLNCLARNAQLRLAASMILKVPHLQLEGDPLSLLIAYSWLTVSP